MKAFPKITNNQTPIFYEGKFAGYENSQDGMDLRDYFAAKAMQGFFSIYGNIRVDKGNTKVKFIAENSYVLADAMMKARND